MSGKLKSNGDLAIEKDSQETIYKAGEYCITSNVQSSDYDLGENDAVAYMCEPCSSEVGKRQRNSKEFFLFQFICAGLKTMFDSLCYRGDNEIRFDELAH